MSTEAGVALLIVCAFFVVPIVGAWITERDGDAS